jgi:hypothetical protein
MYVTVSTGKVRSLYTVDLLSAVAKELSECKLYLVGVQEGRLDRGGTESAGEYAFLHGKGNENHELGSFSLAHKKIICAVKNVDFISDNTPYIILRGHWCHIIVLNVHASADDMNYDMRQLLRGITTCFL